MKELKYFFCPRCESSNTSKVCAKCGYELQEVKIVDPKEYCEKFGCLTYLGPVKLSTCPTCGHNLSGRNTTSNK